MIRKLASRPRYMHCHRQSTVSARATCAALRVVRNSTCKKSQFPIQYADGRTPSTRINNSKPSRRSLMSRPTNLSCVFMCVLMGLYVQDESAMSQWQAGME